MKTKNAEDTASSKKAISIYVDGSYLPLYNTYGGAFVVIKDGVKIDEGLEPGKNEQAAKLLASLAGELNAAMLGVQYAIKHGYSDITLYYDNVGIEQHATKEHPSEHTFIRKYTEYMNKMKEKYSLTLNFKKVKAHSGDKWNEYADKLAKKAALLAKELHVQKRSKRKKKKESPIPVASSSPFASHMKTYDLYRKGHSIEMIADTRHVKVSTVLGHLARCYTEGLSFDISALCDPTIENEVLSIANKSGFNISLIRNRLSKEVCYGSVQIIGAKHGYKIS